MIHLMKRLLTVLSLNFRLLVLCFFFYRKESKFTLVIFMFSDYKANIIENPVYNIVFTPYRSMTNYWRF